MLFPIENRAHLPADAFEVLSAVLAGHRSFKTALDWILVQSPGLDLQDTLAQDEFSYDVLVKHPDGFWIVYDVS